MISPFTTAERVPVSAVERLLECLRKLTAALASSAGADEQPGGAFGRLQRAHHLLSEEYIRLQQEAVHFREGQREALLQHASELRLLARRMDGYLTPDAGELLQMQQRLVLTAWQIAAAASGSEAAGL